MVLSPRPYHIKRRKGIASAREEENWINGGRYEQRCGCKSVERKDLGMREAVKRNGGVGLNFKTQLPAVSGQ